MANQADLKTELKNLNEENESLKKQYEGLTNEEKKSSKGFLIESKIEHNNTHIIMLAFDVRNEGSIISQNRRKKVITRT
jgi:predicted RNase H-like nuclease (RuvC/YqgF family)